MTDVRREGIPLLLEHRETVLGKAFCSNTGDAKYPCACRRTKLPAHSDKVREIGRR